MRLWKNFENRSIFDKDMDRTLRLLFGATWMENVDKKFSYQKEIARPLHRQFLQYRYLK